MNGQHIPERIVRILIGATLALTVVTAAANFGHGQTLALFAGQGTAQAILAAAVPDVLIAVSVTVLAFDRTNLAAWFSLAAAIAFVCWAAVVTSLPGFCLPGPSCQSAPADAATRIAVALWPLLAAVLVATVLASLVHDRADMAAATAADTEADMTPATAADTAPASSPATAPAIRSDIAADTRPDIHPAAERDSSPDIEPDIEPANTGDTEPANPQVIPFTGKQGRVIAKVLAKTITQAAAARQLGVSDRTMARWMKSARAAQDEAQATGT